MAEALGTALRQVARRSGWAVKRDMLSRADGDINLAVHPVRGEGDRQIGFYAKPEAWDRVLWGILQIRGNAAMPVSFRFTGSFTCAVPPLVIETTDPLATPTEKAAQILALARRCHANLSLWTSPDLASAIAAETPSRAYAYHMTRVVERICAGDRHSAREICKAAMAGVLDVRHRFQSADEEGWAGAVAPGRWRSLDFFDLAPLWMDRN